MGTHLTDVLVIHVKTTEDAIAKVTNNVTAMTHKETEVSVTSVVPSTFTGNFVLKRKYVNRNEIKWEINVNQTASERHNILRSIRGQHSLQQWANVYTIRQAFNLLVSN